MNRALSVAFRVDASLRIGNGHVMRCLTLASALRARGARCRFVCREHPGHLGAHILAAGFELALLPAPSAAESGGAGVDDGYAAWLGVPAAVDAAQTHVALGEARCDWLVVDHYALASSWESALRSTCDRLMVLDDLADRAHDCDLLLDQNAGAAAARYAGRVGPRTRLLAGARFALLRPEFAARRDASLARRGMAPWRRLLISLGGVDAADTTGRVLAALATARLPVDATVVVVLGPHAPALAAVRQAAATLPWPAEVRVDVQDMAELLADADLAIGAAGSSAWERCCLGLPTLLVVAADNQRDGAQALVAAGAAWLLGDAHTAPARLADGLAFAAQPDNLRHMQRCAAALVDGQGSARVVEEMLHGLV